MGDEAFENSRFWEIRLNDGLEHIGNAAFANIYNLREIALPDSLEYVAPDAFDKSYGAKVQITASEWIQAMLDSGK